MNFSSHLKKKKMPTHLEMKTNRNWEMKKWSKHTHTDTNTNSQIHTPKESKHICLQVGSSLMICNSVRSCYETNDKRKKEYAWKMNVSIHWLNEMKRERVRMSERVSEFSQWAKSHTKLNRETEAKQNKTEWNKLRTFSAFIIDLDES